MKNELTLFFLKYLMISAVFFTNESDKTTWIRNHSIIPDVYLSLGLPDATHLTLT